MTQWNFHSMAIEPSHGVELVDLMDAKPAVGDTGAVEWVAKDKVPIKVEAVDGRCVRLRIGGDCWIADVAGNVWTLQAKA